MDETILDLKNITALLANVLGRMERLTPEEISAVMKDSKIEETLLEAIGVPRDRLSMEERERFTALIRFVLHLMGGLE